MPADAPESLKAQEYADLIAFLFSVNKFPAGEKELPADPAALEAIRISSSAKVRLKPERTEARTLLGAEFLSS